MPNEDVGSVSNAGAVHVIYGSNGAGLTDAGNQFWHQDSPGILKAAAENDRFGSSISAADFNFDGRFDLAVGVPGEEVGSSVAAGAVNVIYGSASGLTDAGNQVWSQDSAGVLGRADSVDAFGSSLSAEDFDGDGRADLAVGVPNEDVGTVPDAGAVNVVYGAPTGLAAPGNQLWHQEKPGIGGVAANFERFGSSLGAGNFNGDAFGDLAIGVPNETVGSVSAAGVVNVVYGSAPDGLSSTDQQRWHQDSGGIRDVAENTDRFGSSLSAGDFDHDLVMDLAVGVPQENVGSTTDAGAVSVIYGVAVDGLTATDDQIWHQDSAGILDAVETLDQFGDALTVGDFDGDLSDDLAIGMIRESVGSIGVAGKVNVIYGAGGAGLTAADNQIWHQNVAGIADPAESGDSFGTSLSAGDFNSNSVTGQDDLAVGVLGEGIGSVNDAGAVNVINGSTPGGLTATGDQFWHQDAGTILDTAEDTDNFGGGLLGSPF